MLSSLDALAGKLSPGAAPGKSSSPPSSNSNNITSNQHNNNSNNINNNNNNNNSSCNGNHNSKTEILQLQHQQYQQRQTELALQHHHQHHHNLSTSSSKHNQQQQQQQQHETQSQQQHHNNNTHHLHHHNHQQQQQPQLIEQEPPAEQLPSQPQTQEQRLQAQAQQQHRQQQEQLLQHLRFNELDSNCNKLTHINHNAPSHHHHPYQKQQTNQQQQGSPTTPSPFPFQLPQYTPEQKELLQAQHELFQKQLQLQQQQTQKLIATMQQQLQQQQQQLEQDADSQHEFKICLKESAFGMSDKSSTTTSLPNSPIHTTAGSVNNNNGSLLNNNNNANNNSSSAVVAAAAAAAAAAAVAVNNNNNNTCSANRNVVVDDDSCFRMDSEVTYGDKEPDPDNIKMFVGQVPKSMDEAQLREMFEEYGAVHSINVLRDKATGISKGCCFVTFYTRRAALKAQDALHNVKTLNGMYHPIQMKPADSENRNERKLFVGMLNKKLNENDVRKLFEVHGAIEECTVLRDQNGQSKGCAFVTFSTKHAAISAIKVTLNQNKIMEGCTSPLVVKFADTQKEKEQKKIQQIQANLWNLATNINIPLGQTATTVSTPILPNPPQQPSPVLGADALTPASLQLLQQLQAVGLQQQLLQGLGAQPTNNSETAAAATAAAAAAGLLPPMTVQNLAALAAMTQPALTNAATNPGSAQLTNTAALLCLLGKTANSGENHLSSTCNELQQKSQQMHHHQQQQLPLLDLDAFSFPWSDPNSLASAYMSTAAAAALPQFGSAALTTSPLATVALSAAAAAAAGKQIEGPEGCNLFIYHLPQEFTDTDLASTFLPFGNVISAKVFIDKQTSLSKCFGFVSFDNPDSAQVAIKAMNGFQVGTKRLKVQLKKPKDASKPY